MNGQNNTSKSNKIWRLFSAHFIFGKSTRKQQTMVKLQLTANVIAKSGYQIKPKPIKSLPINTILIFSMSDKCIFIAHSPHIETVCQLARKTGDGDTQEDDAKGKGSETGVSFGLEAAGNRVERKINYREEEIEDCGCIYG